MFYIKKNDFIALFNSIFIFSQSLFCLFFEGLGNIVDAADRRDDPDLIAHAGFSVAAAESHEGPVLCGGRIRSLRGIAVIQHISEPGADVVDMHPAAGGDIFLCAANRISVFYDLFSGFDI